MEKTVIVGNETMNYEVVMNENGDKHVIYPDGIKRIVQKDEAGREFFYVPNYRSGHSFKLFTDRIKDAIETIREGYGDVLAVRTLFGTKSESVLRYLDREYGESLRSQTIVGFEDAEFGYSLKFGYLNSMSGSRFISKSKKIIGFQSESEHIFFENETDANSFKLELLAEAEEILVQYNEVKATKDDKKISEFVEKNYRDDIVSTLWAVMAEPSDKNNWKLEAVQVIKKDTVEKL